MRVPFDEPLWRAEQFLGEESRLDREAMILQCAADRERERDREFRPQYMAEVRRRIVAGKQSGPDHSRRQGQEHGTGAPAGVNAWRPGGRPLTSGKEGRAMAEHSVLEYGAKGDGETDDTAAIQACVDACHPGDVARFPAGRCYRVAPNVGINLDSYHELRLEGATVQTLPHASTVSVQRIFSTVPGAVDVRCFGGQLVGSMAALPSGRHLIAWRGDSVDGLHIAGTSFVDWKSDAVWIGGNQPSRHVQLDSILVEGFGRNAVSVVNADGVQILRSRFLCSVGPAAGTAADPGAAVDLEPNQNEQVTNVTLYDCAAEDVEVGFYCQVGKGLPGAGYQLYRCSVRGGRRYGIVVNSAHGASIDACRVFVPAPVPGKNLPVGISCGGASEETRVCDLAVTGNYINGEAPGYRGLVIAGAKDFVVFKNRVDNGGKIEVVGLGASGDYAFLQNELVP